MISALLARLARTRATVEADADAEAKILAVEDARRDAAHAFGVAMGRIDHPIDAHTVTRHRPGATLTGALVCVACNGHPVPDAWPCPPLLAVAHHHGVRVPHGALT